MAGYIYDDAGNPIGFASGAIVDNIFTAEMQTYRNGQTLTDLLAGDWPVARTITSISRDRRSTCRAVRSIAHGFGAGPGRRQLVGAVPRGPRFSIEVKARS
jgi:hypothetical protein